MPHLRCALLTLWHIVLTLVLVHRCTAPEPRIRAIADGWRWTVVRGAGSSRRRRVGGLVSWHRCGVVQITCQRCSCIGKMVWTTESTNGKRSSSPLKQLYMTFYQRTTSLCCQVHTHTHTLACSLDSPTSCPTLFRVAVSFESTPIQATDQRR